jgi:glycosyltransferase involved in cell wall biosynthesis
VPVFSIITPVYNPPIWALEACISSVLKQSVKDWEWCIADDCSTDPEVRRVLTKLSKKDSRVKIEFRSQNGGIIEASNTAVNLATGEFLVLLDHDDSLTPDALSVVAQTIEVHPTVDYLYSDEDKIDVHGNLFDEFRKPDFAPERLRGQNYCSHLSVFRRELIEEIGAFREGFEGSQDYDLILRATEAARSIVHIPEVLYHWRVVEGSTAGSTDAKPYTFSSAHKAVQEHCGRVGIAAEVTTADFGFVHVRRELIGRPKVSIVMPTRGDRKRIWGIDTCLAANAIRSIFEHSTYDNYEIILVHDVTDNLDSEIQVLINDDRLSIVWYSKPFDFSEKCNLGVIASSGEIVILLNDDTEVMTDCWIETLIGFLQDDDVAMVGPLTVLEDGRIQSAGHSNNPSVHNLGGGDSVGSTGYFGSYLISREVSGVTGACAAIPRDKYMKLGGFSTAFPHSFNDVDFSFKALEAGYRIIWTPLAKIRHFESLTRDPQVREEESELLLRRWGRHFGDDRYSS